MLLLQLQQLQRQPKRIIQIPRRLQHLEPRSENLRHGLLRGRLPCRPSHSNHPPAPLRSHCLGKLLQRPQHTILAVRHLQQPLLVHFRRHHPPITHNRRYRTICKRCSHIIMPIQPFAANRKEQLRSANRSRIDSIPHRLCQRIELTISMNPIRNLPQCQLHAISFNTSAATATSSKGTVLSFNICTFSCPLPAIKTISPGRAARIAIAIAPARSSSTTQSVPVSRTPARASSMIAIGSSLRGLSLVNTTRSLPAPATRPIFGRFVRSRSPPHPNSVITRPPRSFTKSRASAIKFLSASSVCA